MQISQTQNTDEHPNISWQLYVKRPVAGVLMLSQSHLDFSLLFQLGARGPDPSASAVPLASYKPAPRISQHCHRQQLFY